MHVTECRVCSFKQDALKERRQYIANVETAKIRHRLKQKKPELKTLRCKSLHVTECRVCSFKQDALKERRQYVANVETAKIRSRLKQKNPS